MGDVGERPRGRGRPGGDRVIRRLIWLYLWLLIFEGALRKWIFPGWSEIFLVIRDPAVIAIYAVALIRGRFPLNVLLVATGVITALAAAFGLMSPASNAVVTAYGLRVNFLHIPLIFIMARVLRADDLLRMGRFILLLTIPMTLLMCLQFYWEDTAWVNRGPGGDTDVGITGARGRNRPPGTFSFITGIAAFYPLALAFFIAVLLHRLRMPRWQLVAVGCAIGLAVPVSISRLTAVSCLIVVFVGIVAALRMPNSGIRIGRLMGVAATALILLSFLDVFDEGLGTFGDRWTTASAHEGGLGRSLWGRFTQSFFNFVYWLDWAPLLGKGVGTGTNVGAALLGGRVGFSLGESEWERAIGELGPFLGVAYIGLRVGLAAYLFTVAAKALWHRNAFPILLFSASGLLVLSGQWGPPTILGFAVFGGGLTLAAARRASGAGAGREGGLEGAAAEVGLTPESPPAPTSPESPESPGPTSPPVAGGDVSVDGGGR